MRFSLRASAIAVVLLLVAYRFHSPASPPAGTGPATVPPADIAPDWWAAVQADIQAQEYAVTTSKDGLQAPNRAHGFRSHYQRQGVAVTPREEPPGVAWQFSWRTTRFGRSSQLQAVPIAAAEPAASGARVDYRHPGLSEWYLNRPEGLEQGFTIADRAAGTGPLVIEGEIASGLAGTLAADRQSVIWVDDAGVAILRYGELHVWDDSQRELESWLALDGEHLSILIADEGARYPLTVDPLLMALSWFAEADQASSQFGVSVNTAGDVNKDGFSDVIVGAPQFDNGQQNEGRAYVYLGSANGLSLTAAWTAEPNQIGATFGLPAAPAGDVNGDGFGDVIIGASNFDNGQTDEGRAFVYLGSASGLAANPAWTAESDQVSAQFGRAAATAGDVNGDGFSDVIVGAPAYENGHTDEGRAYIYHGSASGLGVTAARILEPDQASAVFGTSVGTAGDVNGDGFADVIIGAPSWDNGEFNEGGAFAYYGSAAGIGPSASWTSESNQTSSSYGFAVGTAGDVNGDGYSEVVVGAPFFSNGEASEGRTYGFPGSSGGLLGVSMWQQEPDQANAGWGFAVATAGDVNGDGYADVIAGAPFGDFAEINDGFAQIYLGSPNGLIADLVLHADRINSRFGVAVGTAGDVNGDGFSDVIAGADFFTNGQPDEGKAFLYQGTSAGLSFTNVFNAEANQPGAAFGTVAGAGDVNGDGYSDVLVGAPGFDNGEANEGRVFAYHGSASGLSLTPAWTVEGDAMTARLGFSLAGAGDVNGDGYSDVVVGAQIEGFARGTGSAGQPRGKVFAYHGSPAGLAMTPAWTVEGDQDGAAFGESVAGAGDVNGDGFGDVIVGALLYDNGSEDEGRAFVYEGSPVGLQLTPVWTAESNNVTAHYGNAVSSAGDVNGDGFSDVIVGAPQFANGQGLEGAAFLYAGSPTGPSAAPVWTVEGNQGVATFGFAVAHAGDVNADGFSDVLVGAPSYTNDQLREGRVFMYLGSSGGLSTSSAWTAEGNQTDDFFGASISQAGDVNGDRFTDVIVGIPGYDNGHVDEGRALLYHGFQFGLLQSPVWSAEPNQTSASLGRWVAAAGDVNGDGFADVLVGVPNFDNGQTDEGRAQLYLGNGGRGIDRIPHQTRSGSSTPIALLGRSNSPSGFGIAALGRTAAGRGRVRLEAEVKPNGAPFTGSGLLTSALLSSGAPGAAGSAVPLSVAASGLGGGDLFHWRLRIASDSPYFPRTTWFSLPLNAASEADVRTAFVVGVDDAPGAPAAGGVWLGAGTPNPFSASTEMSYALPRAGHARIAVHDVTGRTVAVLADGEVAAGRHATRWDGRTARGGVAPAGVYFVRLEVEGRVQVQKLVLAR